VIQNYNLNEIFSLLATNEQNVHCAAVNGGQTGHALGSYVTALMSRHWRAKINKKDEVTNKSWWFHEVFGFCYS